jgi:hypothetical protein
VAVPTKKAVEVSPVWNVILAVLVEVRVTVSSMATPVVVETLPLRLHSTNMPPVTVEVELVAPANIPPQDMSETVNSVGT